MSQSFFPITGKQVVPLVRMDDDDGVTFVQARQTGSKQEEEGSTVRIFRFAIGKFIKATVIKIDSRNALSEHAQINTGVANTIIPDLTKRE